MCDFCHKHGEGKKWYLQAKNYAEDLLSDVRRRTFIQGFFANPDPVSGSPEVQREPRIRPPAFVRRALDRRTLSRRKKYHFGQVLPIEDIESIFGFVNSVTRLACYCRQRTVGSEQRYCYGVSMMPEGGELTSLMRGIGSDLLTGPDTAGLETLTADEALTAMRDHEKEGLCHTVWTMVTPYVGGICNCDRTDCLAMRANLMSDIPVMFRAEYVGEVDPQACNGCRACMRACQFGALSYSPATEKVIIDTSRCYGCGVCRSLCPTDAITLKDRNAVPVAANLW